MANKKAPAFQTLKLPVEVTKKYVAAAAKEQEDDNGWYGYRNLAHLTGMGDSRISKAAKGKGKMTMQDMDRISVFSKFNLFEVEQELAEEYPLIFKQLKDDLNGK